MEAFTFAALSALIIKAIGIVKAFGKDWNYVATQVATWIAGVVTILVACHSAIVTAFAPQLTNLDVGAQVLAGLMLASSGSFAYDVKKAIDGTDSATEPRLLPPA